MAPVVLVFVFESWRVKPCSQEARFLISMLMRRPIRQSDQQREVSCTATLAIVSKLDAVFFVWIDFFPPLQLRGRRPTRPILQRQASLLGAFNDPDAAAAVRWNAGEGNCQELHRDRYSSYSFRPFDWPWLSYPARRLAASRPACGGDCQYIAALLHPM